VLFRCCLCYRCVSVSVCVRGRLFFLGYCSCGLRRKTFWYCSWVTAEKLDLRKSILPLLLARVHEKQGEQKTGIFFDRDAMAPDEYNIYTHPPPMPLGLLLFCCFTSSMGRVLVGWKELTTHDLFLATGMGLLNRSQLTHKICTCQLLPSCCALTNPQTHLPNSNRPPSFLSSLVVYVSFLFFSDAHAERSLPLLVLAGVRESPPPRNAPSTARRSPLKWA
jgi:hypothetical protein